MDRWELLQRFSLRGIETGEARFEFLIPQDLVRQEGAGPDSGFWLGWLYEVTEAVPPAYIIWRHWPYPPQDITQAQEIGRWWLSEVHRIRHEGDRRWVWLNREFPRMVESFHATWGPRPAEVLEGLGATPEKRFVAALRRMERMYYMGFHAAWIALNAVTYTSGVPLEPPGLLLQWRGGGPPPVQRGLLRGLGRDDLLPLFTNRHRSFPAAKYGRILMYLERASEKLLRDLRARRPDVSYFDVYFLLCVWDKMWTGTRYMGYYADANLDCLLRHQAWWPGLDFRPLWEGRARHIAPELRGEVGGWTGVRTERKRLFLRTGRWE